jgi:adenylate cyclase
MDSPSMKAPWRIAATGKWKELRLYLIIVAVAYGNTLLLGAASTSLRTNEQNIVFDQYQRWRPRSSDVDQPVRIIDIDDESIRRVGQWPWPRQRMADMVKVLINANVATITFAVLFSEKDRSSFDNSSPGAPRAAAPAGHEGDSEAGNDSDGDVAFARAISNRPVVLGDLFTTSGVVGEIVAKGSFAIIGDAPIPYLPQLSGALTPLPIFMAAAAGVGFVNWQADSDRVVRRVPLLLAANGQMQPSLAIESLRVAQGASNYIVKSGDTNGQARFGESGGVVAIKVGDLVIPTQPGGDIRAYFAKSDPHHSIPAWKIFDHSADLSDLAGKIVVVGATASMMSDIVATPLNPSTPGVEAQAQLIEQLLSGVGLLRPDWAPGAELLGGTALTLALVVAAAVMPVLWSALLGAVAVAVIAGTSWLAFTWQGVLLDPIWPSLSSGAVFLAGVLALYSQKRRQVGEIRSAFGRFVSPAVVERLAEHPESLQLGGLERNLTVMFCDLRSFTTLSEGFSAVELTSFLNEYLTPMTDVVLSETGTVDKYMGDAIMAFWNAPLDDPDHAVHAVRAALEMRDTLAKLNLGWAKRASESDHSFHKVKFGVGLNTGECCVGNLGSTRRFDYSAIGDEVNIASRLEGASKFFGVDVVASASTREAAPHFAWLEIDRVLLKNKTRPTAVFALAGRVEFAASPAFQELARLHAEILSAYREREFGVAVKKAAEAENQAPDEVKGLYFYYQMRFARLATSELDASWTPMIALDEK